MAATPTAAGLERTRGSLRKDFPLLSRVMSGGGTATERPLVYLDNAATTQKPRAVIDAIVQYYERSNANVHRGIHQLSEEATALYEGGRQSVARLINAADSREIVMTRGTTESINLVAHSYARKNLVAGDEILLTEMEHHSNLVPWQMLANDRGLTLRFIPFDKDGQLDLSRLDEIWSERVKFVSVIHMSNVFGSVVDVRAVCDYAHHRGIPVLVDAAQSVPHMPVDVQEIGCDFLAFSGHKVCGPTGVGALYARGDLLDRMDPYQGGGEMIAAVWLDRATWNDPPHKFEAGTPNIAGAVGLGAAIEYVEAIGMPRIAEMEMETTQYALDVLQSLDGVSIYGPLSMNGGRGGVISFNIADVHGHDVAQFLDREGIAVRAGHHCAHPVMRKLGVPSTVRASLYFYTTREEIDALALAIEKTKEFFRHGI